MDQAADRAATLYEAGQHDELWALADHLWAEQGDEPSTDVAEVCFFARTAYARAGQWGAAGLWGARAMVASILSGSRMTGARLLLPEFFRLQAQGSPIEARQVLHEMTRLVNVDDPDQGSQVQVFARLYHEKLATSFLLEGDFDEAIAHYREALDRSQDDPRGHLKVRGGLALATYLSATSDGSATQFRGILTEIRDAAEEQGFPDVVADATHDLGWLAGDEDDWRPFEVL